MTHAGNVLPLADCEKIHARKKTAVGRTIGLLEGMSENPVSLAWLVRQALQRGKSSVADVRSKRQYCVPSEDRHRLVFVPRVFDLLTFDSKIN